MKILHLVTKRQYRGAEVFAANLSKELITLGHEIIFVGLYKNSQNVLHVQNAVNLDIAEKKKGSFSVSLVNNLVRLIRNQKPDVIQCNGSDTLKYMVAASLFLPKIPIVYRNISIISKWMIGEHKKHLYEHMLKRVSHVSSVGDGALEDFVKTFNYPIDKTSVIRRGIPIIEVDQKKARINLNKLLGLKESDKVAIHIGNFSPEKNHIFLLEVFSQIVKTNTSIKLVCVGNGLLLSKIEKEINERHLQSNIFLLGFRKDIPELVAAADCFVLSSKVEGVPGVILEAATQRKPSLAINVGGVSEVLFDKETGYCINDFDVQEYSQKLIELLNNQDLRIKMGDKAFEVVQEYYNPYKNAKIFERLYQDLILKNKYKQGVS